MSQSNKRINPNLGLVILGCLEEIANIENKYVNSLRIFNRLYE